MHMRMHTGRIRWEIGTGDDKQGHSYSGAGTERYSSYKVQDLYNIQRQREKRDMTYGVFSPPGEVSRRRGSASGSASLGIAMCGGG